MDIIDEFNRFFDSSAHIEIDEQGRLIITIGSQAMLISFNIEEAACDKVADASELTEALNI